MRVSGTGLDLETFGCCEFVFWRVGGLGFGIWAHSFKAAGLLLLGLGLWVSCLSSAWLTCCG